MRKRIEPSLVENAITMVSGFDVVFKKLEQQVVLRGQSKSTLNNYIRSIATISMHFEKPTIMKRYSNVCIGSRGSMCTFALFAINDRCTGLRSCQRYVPLQPYYALLNNTSN